MEALRLVNTTELSREEWLHTRKRGIGGSDIAAIAGLNPWKKPIAVYLEKIDEMPEEEDNERMRWGRILESVVAAEFSRRNQLKTSRVNAILQDKEYPFLLANIDRLVYDKERGNAVLEIKTTSAWNGKEWENGNIPDWVMAQLQHYLGVTGLQYGYVAALIGGNQYVQYEVPRDEEIISYLRQIAIDFWQKVGNRTPPELDGSQASSQALSLLYPQSEPESEVELPAEEVQELLQQYDEALAEEKAAKEKKDEAANKIKALMGENEKAVVGERKVNWKLVRSNKLDTKKLKKDYPDICEQYTYKSEYRRFTVV